MPMNREGATAPEILTVEQMLERMREGTKTTHEVRLRGMTFTFRVLSLDEVNAIRRQSIAIAKTLDGDKVDANVEMQKSTLMMASQITPNGVPTVPPKLLTLMSTDEVNYLYEEYLNLIDRANPSIESVGAEEFRSIVEALKKNQITWKDLGLRQLRAICTAFQDMIQRPDTPASPQAN